MTRKFEVVSKYKDVTLPKRSTVNSAGYDFFVVEDVTLKAHKTTLIPTGVKATFPADEVLMLFNRSSNGIKRNLIIPNGVGIVDSDYFNNPNNEGDIAFAFYNTNDEDFKFKKGDKLGQGIFMKFLLTDDDNASGQRNGGFGSTDKQLSLGIKLNDKSSNENLDKTKKAIAYVDGSYDVNTRTYGSGVLLIVDGVEYEFTQKGTDVRKASMRNVAGEIDAAMLAVNKVKEMGIGNLTIYYDYDGIKMWPKLLWKANKEWTQEYRNFMNNSGVNIKYVHVKGHTGDYGNERADELAKRAIYE